MAHAAVDKESSKMMIFPSPGDINSHLASLPAPLHPPTPLPAISQWLQCHCPCYGCWDSLGLPPNSFFRRRQPSPNLTHYSHTPLVRSILLYNGAMKSFADLERIAQSYKSIIIVPHKHPDGDALGAAFGLQGMLQPFCKAHIKVVGEHTSWSTWMGSFERVAEEEWATSLVLVVDTAKEELLFHKNAVKGAEVVLIDHHPQESPFYSAALIDEQATSTSEILALMADKASLSLDEKTANLLLYGLLSDTTVLQHPYTSRATMRAVAYLIGEGATYKPLVNRLIKRPFDVTKALHEASQSIELTANGLAYWMIDYHKIASERFTFNDLFSILRSIEEAVIIVLVVTLEDHIVLHAQSDHYNLQKILTPFGGGGHKFASKVRATSMTPILEVIEALDKMLEQAHR